MGTEPTSATCSYSRAPGGWGETESRAGPAPAPPPAVCEEKTRPLLLLKWIQHQLDVCFFTLGWIHFPVYFSTELAIMEFSDLNPK